MQKATLKFVFCICLVTTSLWAAEPRIDIQVQDQPEAQFDSVAGTQVIIPSKIQGFAQTVPELLERAAGVHLQSYGGLDDFSTVSIRGSTTEQVLIYVDGILINSAEGGAVDLSFLPLDNIARIEIYRGGAPGKIVDSTPGGVIYIHTKGKPDKTENILRNSVGSFYTYRGHIQRSQPINDLYYTAAFDYFRSRGNFPYVNDQGTRSNVNDDQVVDRANNDFKNYNFTGIFGSDKKDEINFKIFENFFAKEQGIPGLGSFLSTSARLETLRNFIHAKLDGPTPSARGVDWNADLFFDYLDNRFHDPSGQIGLGVQDNNDKTLRGGPEFHLDWAPTDNQLLSGFIAYRIETFLPTNYNITPADGPTSWRHMVGLGAENEITLMDEKIVIDPSLRLQIFVNRLSGQNPGVAVATPDNNITNTELSAKVGAKISPWPFLSFKGNFYHGFRQPTFNELFGDRGTFVGNPSLKPEEGFNFDFGISGRWNNFWKFDHLFAEATLFRQNTSNLIQYLQNSQFTAKAENLNGAQITGGEFAVGLQIFKHFRWNGNYIYQSAKDDADNSPTRGKFLPGRPKNQAYMEASYEYRMLQPFGQVQYLSDNYLDSQNLLKVTSRTLVSLGLHLKPADWCKITFTTKNLLNDQTVDIAGFPLPGRSYWGELELRL
ncbi:MAG: TonB-dependent receptor [Deltaproteobacteria bacterium]|nr:TonB-dependent receptor [Deltaproteobacteria bacterium]